MSMDGTGMAPPPASDAAGAVTSRETTRKNPGCGERARVGEVAEELVAA